MSDQDIDNLPPHGRRSFFAASLARILGPLAGYLEDRLPIKLPAFAERLRPPGALPEKAFLETCYRSGNCADACPVSAILLLHDADEGVNRTPYVDPSRRACVMCDELACMKGCPSGALKLVAKLGIRMGLARSDHSLCVRSRGVDCTKCLDVCPLGPAAIRLDQSGRVRVIDPAQSKDAYGCTGCGLCQQHCPTVPKKAIRVHPY